MRNSLLNPISNVEKSDFERANLLRPSLIKDFIGQRNAIRNLMVFIDSAKQRDDAMDHVLFYGPPGLGKTTLARIIANELGVGFRSTSAPIITKTGDLASILTNVEERDVLFIDEIHRLNPTVEETLYSALEDFKLDIIIGEGPGAKSIKIDLPRFTMVGATTRTGLLTSPLRDRFGIPMRLQFYDESELAQIVMRNANVLGVGITEDGSMEIAKRSRGTPRISIRLLKRVHDFATVSGADSITREFVDKCLTSLEVNEYGLDAFDVVYLSCILNSYNGGPVGLDTLSAALQEEKDAIEDVVEPYLIQSGFLLRTRRGRILTDKAKIALGLNDVAGSKRPG